MPSDTEIIAIMGKKFSGKSYYAKEFLKGKKCIVWDVNKEYPKEVSFVPKKVTLNAYEKWVAWVWKKLKNCYVVTDEAHNVLPTNLKDLPPNTKEMFTRCRHRGISLVYIFWRPAMIQASIMEQADKLIIFETHGVNNIKKLNDLHEDMGDMADSLAKHHYIEYDGHEPIVRSPV